MFFVLKAVGLQIYDNLTNDHKLLTLDDVTSSHNRCDDVAGSTATGWENDPSGRGLCWLMKDVIILEHIEDNDVTPGFLLETVKSYGRVK